jgi:hypothetical protein
MNNLSIKKVATVSGLFLGAFALSVLAADWTEAPCAAPGCNTAAPINVSRDAQTKLGGMVLAGGDATPSGAMLDVDGVGSFTGLSVAGRISSNFLTLTAPGYATANYVLTNTGGGNAEWKAPSSGGLTISEIKAFSIYVKRHLGVQSTETDSTYLFCALSRIESELGRTNAGVYAGNYCQVTKKANGKWAVSGWNADDPEYTCEMTCFK